MKSIACLVAVAAVSLAMSQDVEPNDHFVNVYFGKSVIVFGSSQVRWSEGFSYGYAKHEPRFENRFLTGQFVNELYYYHSTDNSGHSPFDPSNNVGFLSYARWFARMPRTEPRPFLDIGWGFQYADQRTTDLPSAINSTPFADLGFAFPINERQEAMIGLRFLHVSNAGFVSPNRGQNNLSLIASLTF